MSESKTSEIKEEDPRKPLVDWLDQLATGEATLIERKTLRTALEKMGADFDQEEKAKKIFEEKYKSKNRIPGLGIIWGEGRISNFTYDLEMFIMLTEKAGEKWQSFPGGDKTRGPTQSLVEITQLAIIDDEAERGNIFKRLQTRVNNGRLAKEGRKNERTKMATPISKGKEIYIAEVPPRLPQVMLMWLSSPK